LELGGFRLVAAASWISVALGAISIAGLIEGWLSYEITPRFANGNGIFRVTLMTLFATTCAMALSIGYSQIVWPFSMHTLALYSLLLPIPCLVIVPLWAAIYLQLVRLQERLEHNAAVLPRDDMVRLLAGLHQSGRSTTSSGPGDLDPSEGLAVPRHRR